MEHVGENKIENRSTIGILCAK